MSDDLIEQLLRRRKELEVEMTEIDRFILDYRRMAAKVAAMGHPAAAASPTTSTQSGTNREHKGSDPTPESGVARPSSRAEIAAEMVKLIKSVGYPVPLSDAYDTMLARGIRIGGDNPKANFAAKLNQSKKELLGIRGRGWWLRGVPVPQPIEPTIQYPPADTDHLVKPPGSADSITGSAGLPGHSASAPSMALTHVAIGGIGPDYEEGGPGANVEPTEREKQGQD